MLEIKEIRNKLDQISIIKALDIKSISYKKIEYEISWESLLAPSEKCISANIYDIKM